MGFESVEVEASYRPRRFPHLTDRINRLSQETYAEVLELKGLKIWEGTNRARPCTFGAVMATQAGESSKPECTLSTSQFPEFDVASSLSSTDVGYANLTTSVSELLAFRSRGSKVNYKQTSNVYGDSIPALSSPATVSFSCGDTTVEGSLQTSCRSLPYFPPKVVMSGSIPVTYGRESSSPVSKDSNCAISSFASFTSDLRPSTSSCSSVPFVFCAGTSGSGCLEPGTQSSTPFDRLSSEFSRSSTHSNNSTDGLISGRPWVQPKVASDGLISASMSLDLNASLPKCTSFLGSSQPLLKSNVFSNDFLSVPTWTTAQVCGSVKASYLGSFDAGPQSEGAVESESEGSLKPLGQSDIPLQALFPANTSERVVGGMPTPAFHGNRFAGDDFGISCGISRKLNELDIDDGVLLLPNLGKLHLDDDGERVLDSYAAKAELEQLSKNLNFDSRECHPLSTEKLAAYNLGEYLLSGKNTSVYAGRSTKVSGISARNSNTFVFHASKARTGIFPDSFEVECSDTPSAPNFSSAFKFSATWKVKPPVLKVKKDKFRHRPLRPGLRSNVKGKNREPAISTERPGSATPTPSVEGVLMDISPQSSSGASTNCKAGSVKPWIPDFNEKASDEECVGASNVIPMEGLEVSTPKLRAAVSELNFGPVNNRTKQTSISTAIFKEEQESWSCMIGKDEEASNSTNHPQAWERAPVADTRSAERSESEINLAEHCGTFHEVNERRPASFVYEKNSGAGGNLDETDASSVLESSSCNEYCQPGMGGDAKGHSFTFTASPKGVSTSSLRRHARRVLRSAGRVKQSDKAAVFVLQPVRSISSPLSPTKSRTWTDTAFLGGLGGSGYQEGVHAQEIVGGVSVAEQVSERWRLRGNQAYSKGDFAKAEEFYTLGAESVSPYETSGSCLRASMLCFSNRAATRMVVGRMREALADCVQAIAVEPSFVRAHLRAAGCHLALGETELAASAFRECLRRAQAGSNVDCKVLADASDGLKKTQQVAEYCIQARKLVLSNSSVDSAAALLLLDEALLASPQSECLLELKAYTLVSLQRYTEAVQVCEQSAASAERNHTTLERASSRLENSPLCWRRRITVKANFHLGKLEEALEQLEQLHEDPFFMFSADPDLPGALSAEITLHSKALIGDLLRHKLEGNRAFQAGKFTEALEHYTAALVRNTESRPFCAVCLCNRAAASQALGHIVDAIADCSRAIALDPLYVKAISRRASLHEKVRDYGPSCCDLGRLIAIYETQLCEVQGSRSLRVEELQLAQERLTKAEDELKKGFPLDHYGILGLELGCSGSEIKKAYRRAALRHHPDKAGQFLLRSGDSVDDPVKDAMDEAVRRNGESLIDELRKDSEQLFKLVGEAYAVLSDPAKRSRYDSEEELRKLRTRSSDSKNVNVDRKHFRPSDAANVSVARGGWSSCSSAGESWSRSRASRQRERWEGFNYQYQRWHSGPDAAQPDMYARSGLPPGSTFDSSCRHTSWRWEEYPWDDAQ